MKPVQDHWNAKDYAGNSSAQEKWAQELLAKFSLTGDEHVLDIGCGDGKITSQIAQRVLNGQVCGIDLSPEMIRLAKERYPQDTHRNLSFLQMDAREINLADKFDVVFSNAALHWVDNLPAVLRGVHACMNPGGKILFQLGGTGNAADILCAVDEIIGRPVWKDYFQNFIFPYHFYNPEQCTDWLRETGFTLKRAELIPRDMRHQDKEELKGWLRTTWFPYTNCLPFEVRDHFLEAVMESYCAKHPFDPLGRTHVRMIRLEIEATVCA